MTARAFYMLILGPVFVYVVLLTLLVIFQRSFIYFPDTTRPDLAAYGQVAEGYQVITAQTEDGLRLEGWYYQGDADKPVILWFHGNASNYANRVYWAQHLTKAGYSVVLAGYRGYAGNPGTYTEGNLYKDAHAWVKTVQNDLHVSPGNLVLYGESLGSGIAVEIATHYDVRALILHTPYKSLRALAERTYPIFPIKYVMYDQYDSLSRIPHIHKMPVLMFHGTQDNVIPFTHARELFDAAPKPKTFVALEGASHSDVFSYGADRAIFDFLNQTKSDAVQK